MEEERAGEGEEGQEGNAEELLAISCGSWDGLGEAYEDECPRKGVPFPPQLAQEVERYR